MEWIYRLDEVQQTATQLWKASKNTTVFAFHGAMGAGKTTFIRALCDVKKVTDVVGSPTFSIINEYGYKENRTEKKIFHIDLYRLRDQQEAIQAGIEDCLYSDCICLIEWPEKILLLLPPGTVHIYIDTINEQTRRLQIRNN